MGSNQHFFFSQTLTRAPHLLKHNPLERELIYGEFKRALRQYDHMGFGYIDIALWDLFGKRAGLSIATLLGGWRKRLPAYASTMHGDRNGALSSPQDYVDFAEECYSLGYRAFKMHGWYDGDVAEESAVIRLLGQCLGDRMALAARSGLPDAYVRRRSGYRPGLRRGGLSLVRGPLPRY